jgi:O-antigen/teichoic acid export membrane protein
MSIRDSVYKIGKLGIVYITSNVVALLVNLFVLPIFTKYLHPDQMGIVNLSRQIITPLSMLINLGILDAMTCMYYRTEEHLRSTLTRTVFIGTLVQMLLFTMLLSVFSGWLSRLLLPNIPLGNDYKFCLWWIIVAASVATSYATFGYRINQINEQSIRATTILMVEYFVGVVLGVPAVVFLGLQGFGRQVTLVIATIVSAIVGYFLSRRYQKGYFDWALYKQLLCTGVKFLPHSLSGVLTVSTNMWLLAKLISAEALGVYGIAIFFAGLAQMPLAAFNYAAYPTLAKLMTDGSNDARVHQSRIYTILLCFLFGFVLCLSLSGSIGIKILTDPAYHGAIKVLPLILLGWLIQFLYWVLSNPVYNFGGGLWMASATLSSLLVGILLNLIITPMWGLYGAAISLIGCFTVRWIVISIISHRMYPLPWEYSKIIKCFVFTIILATFDCLIINRVNLFLQILSKLVLMAAYLWGIFLFDIINLQQVKIVFGELKGKFIRK